MSLSSVTLPGRPRPAAFVASLLVAWLLLALIALGLRRGPIESDLAERATEAVRREVASSAEVTFDGTDAVVSGTFASAADAEAARLTAAAVDGASSARLGDDVTIASVPPPPLVLALTDGTLVLTVTVPDQRTRQDLLDAAVSASSGAITANVTVDPDLPGPAIDGLAQLSEALSSVPGDHEVSLTGGSVVLSGTAPDAAAGDKLSSSVLAAAELLVPGATLDNELVVERAEPAARPPADPDGRGGPAGPVESSPPTAPGASAEPTGNAEPTGRAEPTGSAEPSGSSAPAENAAPTETVEPTTRAEPSPNTRPSAPVESGVPGARPPAGGPPSPTASAGVSQPPSPGAGPGAGADAVLGRLEEALGDSSVTFDRGSTVVAPSAGALLDEVAAVLATGELAVDVVGHADATGPAALNERLSAGRAQAVVDYLVAAGVPAPSLRAVGVGSTQSVASNDTVAGRAANRRVEFVARS